MKRKSTGTSRQETVAVPSVTGQGAFLLYQTEDAQTQIQVRLQDGGLWLTQQQLADLYQSTPQNITQHVRSIYATGELQEAATCKPYLQVRQERGRQVSRSLKHYKMELDNFLRMTRKDILTRAGKVSAEAALAKAQEAYAQYQQKMRNLPTSAEKDFEAAIAQPVKQLEESRKKTLLDKDKGDKA